MIGVEVQGLGAIKGTIDKLSQELKRKEIAAIKEGALVFQNRWQATAPVKTGTYKRSIGTTITQKYPETIAMVGEDITKPPYPFFLEFGTIRRKGKNAGKRIIKPYLTATKAWEQTKHKIIIEVERLMIIAGLR